MTSVEDFMAKLAAQAAPVSGKREFKEKKRMIEKISLNFEGNFGRYQIFPMDNVVTDYPFITLRGTKEVCIPKKIVASDGTENVFNSWIRIIPKDAYLMKDMTGRTVSSLTAEEEQLLSEANTVFDQLFEESGAKDNPAILKSLVRKRNYTIFHGYCINKWGFDNNRSPERSNFSGLFICTASGFAQAVADNVNERSVMNGGDTSFIKSIYGRQTSGRDGFMMFSISRNKSGNGKGYSVSVAHESGKSAMLSGITIPEEDAKLMEDPLASFLGWQAKFEENVPAESRRLFNAPLIKSAIQYMTQQLAAIRLAKQAGTSLEEAIAATNELALSSEEAATPEIHTNDPMIADMSTGSTLQETAELNQRIVDNNTNPFATPAAGHFDPITGAPVASNNTATQSTPFTQPSFANFNGANTGNTGMPF